MLRLSDDKMKRRRNQSTIGEENYVSRETPRGRRRKFPGFPRVGDAGGDFARLCVIEVQDV